MPASKLDTSPWNLPVAMALLSAACGQSEPAVAEGGETGFVGECRTDDGCEGGRTCSSSSRCVPGPSAPDNDDDYDGYDYDYDNDDDDDDETSAWEYDYECYEDADCEPEGVCNFAGEHTSRCEFLRPVPCPVLAPLELSVIETPKDTEWRGLLGSGPESALAQVRRYTEKNPVDEFLNLETGVAQGLSNGAEVRSAASADLDGDGDGDLVVGLEVEGGTLVETHLRAEDGSFALHGSVTFPPGEAQLHLVRDGAGLASVVVVQSDGIWSAAGDGTGSFGKPTAVEFPGLGSPSTLFVGQFDDGPAQDLAMDVSGSLVFLGDATPREPLPLYPGATLTRGDLTGDGLDDFVSVVPHASSSIFVRAELSAAPETAPPYALIDGPDFVTGIATKDVDGDGKSDVLALAVDPNAPPALIVVRNIASPEEICVDYHELGSIYEGLWWQRHAGVDGVVALANQTEVVRIEPG